LKQYEHRRGQSVISPTPLSPFVALSPAQSQRGCHAALIVSAPMTILTMPKEE
jgi:hypothetical protein